MLTPEEHALVNKAREALEAGRAVHAIVRHRGPLKIDTVEQEGTILRLYNAEVDARYFIRPSDIVGFQINDGG